MPTTEDKRTMTAEQVQELIEAHLGRTVHIEATGGVDYPNGYRSRDHHPIHVLEAYGRGDGGRMYAYFRTLPLPAHWTTYYRVGLITWAEVA